VTDIRPPAVAGTFYPRSPVELRAQVEGFLAQSDEVKRPARGAIVPHAGLIYSGACAAEVFARVTLAPVVVILAPNHTGVFPPRGIASVWPSGGFETPLGVSAINEVFVSALCRACPGLVADRGAHRGEHAVEVELPFLEILAPDSSIVPIVVNTDEWKGCRDLAQALAATVESWPEPVLIMASSDMTHYDSAESAAVKDRRALAHVEMLDGEGLLAECHHHDITMCGRAPAATVVEAARLLGADKAEVVDYRHSGWVTGDDRHVVAYAGVVIE
jgi:AmmeMemoRadiSam system protein B